MSEDPRASIDCAECRALLSRFVERGLSARERGAMRGHLHECDACLPLYRGTLTSAARVGHAQREKRLEREARVRRETHREMALSATVRRRPSRHALRLVLLPGLMALLIILVNGGFSEKPGVGVEWRGGEVEAAGVPLDAERPEVRLGAGTWCTTGEDGAARLRRGGASVELAANAAVRVEEEVGELRLRVHHGELVVRGTAELSTVFGVARLEEGRGRLTLADGELRVECVAGRWIVAGPLGERTVSAGSSAAFGPSGALP